MVLEYPFQAVLEALIKARQAPPESAYAANAVSTGLDAFNVANKQRQTNEQKTNDNALELAREYINKGYRPTIGGNPASMQDVLKNAPGLNMEPPAPKPLKIPVVKDPNKQKFYDLKTKEDVTNQYNPDTHYTAIELPLNKPASDGEDKKLTRLTALGKDLDPSSMTRGPMSISKQVFDRAERLQSLEGYVNAYQQGNADSRQIEELAIGLNALLSGSNTGAQEQVKQLVPKSAIGNVKKLYEFLSNNPTGLNQQEFVKRMYGTIANEKQTSQNQVKRTQYQRIAKYPDVEKSNPEDFKTLIQSFGINPEEYYSWKKNGFKQIDAVAGGQNTGTIPVGTIEDGYKFKGGNPADKNSWEKQ